MARVDPCISLGWGQSPILTSPSPSPSDSNAVRTGSYYKRPAYSDTEQCIDGVVDSRLAAIFHDLQRLARRTNGATSGQEVMQESELHAGIWTAQYQLFQLEGVLNDILGECLRVAMLIFLTTTFQVLGSRIKYEHTTKRFRVLCRAIGASTQQLQELVFWTLMVGAIAVFDHDEPWLCQRWRSLVPGQDWIAAQQRLRSSIWINVCNESIGKHTFEKMRQNSRKTLGLWEP